MLLHCPSIAPRIKYEVFCLSFKVLHSLALFYLSRFNFFLFHKLTYLLFDYTLQIFDKEKILLVFQFFQSSDSRFVCDCRDGLGGPCTTSYVCFHTGHPMPDTHSPFLHFGLATEVIIGMLANFSFIHHFSQGCTIMCSIFVNNSSFFDVFSHDSVVSPELGEARRWYICTLSGPETGGEGCGGGTSFLDSLNIISFYSLFSTDKIGFLAIPHLKYFSFLCIYAFSELCSHFSSPFPSSFLFPPILSLSSTPRGSPY